MIAAVLTFLDPPETDWHLPKRSTTVDVDGSPDPSIAFRHSGWARSRLEVRDALLRTGAPDSRLENFDACGSAAWVYEDPQEPGTYYLRGSNCHDRWCLPCAVERAHTIARNIQTKLAGNPARFLTLTLRTKPGPLKPDLDRLYASFARLRRTRLWTAIVTGGCALVELKWSLESARWHPHLHCIIQGRYLPHLDLRRAWKKATGDSFVLDIRKIKGTSAAVRYVTKYASKPFDSSFLHQPQLLDEAVRALKGRKLVVTFGDWRGLDLTAIAESPELIPVCSLRTLLKRAHQSDPEAVSILHCLERRIRCPVPAT